MSLFKSSLQYIKHRGPDFDDCMKLNEYTALGHTRLSIIDLSDSSNQPLTVDDRYTITFNGEIFNYIEIKDELKAKGVSFQSTGDTEVILKAYEHWGESCVKKFNGMWAFAIYDKKLNKLFCSRDRFGIKPFSYSLHKDSLIFSSENKPIIHYFPELRKPNYNVIANFCYKSLGAQCPDTWFLGVKRLAPGYNMIWDNGKLSIEKYWDYDGEIDSTISYDESKEEFRKLLNKSVEYRLRSDVELGSTLTSGLDSSTIVGLIKQNTEKKINTFTAYNKSDDYKENDIRGYKTGIDLDESKITKKLNKDFNTTPNEIRVDFSNYVQKLKEVIYYMESGHSSLATISILQVYKEAKKKVKVLMEGQGADEVLGGYILNIFPYYLYELLKKGRFRKLIKEFKAFNQIYSIKFLIICFLRSMDSKYINDIRLFFNGVNMINRKKFQYKYLKDNTKEGKNYTSERLNAKLINRHSGGLINLLHYGDALSMSQGIECRLPFMDYKLVEYIFKLSYKHKVNNMMGKILIRDSFKDILPKYIYESKIKIGFSTPIDEIFTSNTEVEDILLHYNYDDFFDNSKIKKIYKKNKSGKKNYATLLFKILSAKIWFKTYIESDKLEML